MMDARDYALIPEYTMESLRAYIDAGRPTGGFLEAMLSNDLSRAVGNADSNNLNAIAAIVCWLYNEAPSDCWGSPERVGQWLKQHREALERRAAVEAE